ncbi:gamma-glutamyltransferase, partial [Pseudomonas syringae pv. pisi str. 1704B]
AAADAPRWRIEAGLKVAVERAFDPEVVKALRAKGHDIDVEEPSGVFAFGGAQIIQRTAHGYGGRDRSEEGRNGRSVLSETSNAYQAATDRAQ